MTKTIREVALELYTPPFSFRHGYVFDSKGHMVADQDDVDAMRESIAARIRGWGRIQYMDNPMGRAAALQDEVGQIVVEALNAFWAAQKGGV
jgi:hypothetical protein